MTFKKLTQAELANLQVGSPAYKKYMREWIENELQPLPKEDRDLVLKLFKPEDVSIYSNYGSLQIYRRIGINYNPSMKATLQAYANRLEGKDYKNTTNPRTGVDLYQNAWTLSSQLDIPVDSFLRYTFGGNIPDEVRRNAVASTFIPEKAKEAIIPYSRRTTTAKVVGTPSAPVVRNVSNVKLPTPLPKSNVFIQDHTVVEEVTTVSPAAIKAEADFLVIDPKRDKVEVLSSNTIKVNGVTIELAGIEALRGRENEAQATLQKFFSTEGVYLENVKKRSDTSIVAEAFVSSSSRGESLQSALVRQGTLVPTTTKKVDTPKPAEEEKASPPVTSHLNPANSTPYDPNAKPTSTPTTAPVPSHLNPANSTPYDPNAKPPSYEVLPKPVENYSTPVISSPNGEKDLWKDFGGDMSLYAEYLKSIGKDVFEKDGEYFIRNPNNPSHPEKIVVPLPQPGSTTYAPITFNQNVHTSLNPIVTESVLDEVSPKGFYYYPSGSYSVIDGDTIKVNSASVRFTGLDAHESNSIPGSEAKKRLTNFLSGKGIVVKKVGVDSHGRVLGVIYVADSALNVNAWVLRNQLAVLYSDYLGQIDADDRDAMLEAAAKAKDDYKNNRTIGPESALNPIWPDPEFWRNRMTDKEREDFNEKHARLNGDLDGSNGTFNKDDMAYKEDENISMESEYNHLSGEASIGHLSRLYDTYYSSADVKVWIKREDGVNPVMVDLITGIGYNYQVNSMPVYTVGSRFPVFFSRGNSLGTGTIVVPFKHAKYMRAMLKYVFDEEDSGAQAAPAPDPQEADDIAFAEIYSSALMGVSDIIEVGSVVTLFDIEIRFDNSNAFARDFGKSKVILKDCKLTGDGMEIASGKDVSLQVGYSFIFKSIITGDANEKLGGVAEATSSDLPTPTVPVAAGSTSSVINGNTIMSQVPGAPTGPVSNAIGGNFWTNATNNANTNTGNNTSAPPPSNSSSVVNGNSIAGSVPGAPTGPVSNPTSPTSPLSPPTTTPPSSGNTSWADAGNNAIGSIPGVGASATPTPTPPSAPPAPAASEPTTPPKETNNDPTETTPTAPTESPDANNG